MISSDLRQTILSISKCQVSKKDLLKKKNITEEEEYRYFNGFDPNITYYHDRENLYVNMSLVYGIYSGDLRVIRSAFRILQRDFYGTGIKNFYFINIGYGGEVYSGIAIKDEIDKFLSIMKFEKSTFVISGLVASASTFPMVAFDEILITKGSELLFHDVSTFVGGNRREIDEQRRNLESISQATRELLLDIPRKQVGRDFINRVFEEGRDEFLNEMESERLGLVDGVYKYYLPRRLAKEEKNINLEEIEKNNLDFNNVYSNFSNIKLNKE